MSKYIVDIPDNVKKIVYFHVGNAKAVWTTSNDLDDLELLNSDYINEHFGNLQDAAYQKSFEDGKAVNQNCEGCKYAEMGSDTTICAQCCNGYHNQWTAKDTYYDIIRNSIHNWVTELNVKLEDISKVLEDMRHD